MEFRTAAFSDVSEFPKTRATTGARQAPTRSLSERAGMDQYNQINCTLSPGCLPDASLTRDLDRVRL